MHDLMELLGFINIGDFIPWLDWIGRVNGFDERLDRIAKEMDEVLECVIQERLEVTRSQQMGENFLDILLEIYKGNTEDASTIDRVGLKSIILVISSSLCNKNKVNFHECMFTIVYLGCK